MHKTSLSSLLLLTILFFYYPVSAQSAKDQISEEISKAEIKLNIHLLAADEFLGRDTGSHELDIAARYIATWFMAHGIEPAEGYDSYFQEVPLRQLSSPETITFSVGDSTFQKNRDLIMLNQYRGVADAPIIFLEHATREEIEEHDVKGKMIVTNAGFSAQATPQQLMMQASQKNEWAAGAGAAGLIEFYNSPMLPWQFLVSFLGGDRIQLDSSASEPEAALPHLWMNASQEERIHFITGSSGEISRLEITGPGTRQISSRNVIGVIRGTDPDLRDEYLFLGAHYDHEGVVDDHPVPITGEYIYNGARDNAVGVAGIMSAAKYLSRNPPKRSVAFAAWTAEEKGLLGSRYYSDNPMIPLNQTIYNLNIDGAGYNDTTKVTVIGLGRTEADEEIIHAAAAFGLEAIPDPVPEQNLFDRSDNVNFARHGIPAPTYSMGLTAFDDEISHYYHRVTDEADTIDFKYVTRYIRSFVLAAQSIANRETAPFWLPGDVYEDAGFELFGKD